MRYFEQRRSLKAEPRLLALQLGVDFHLLQRHLALLQRRELLEPWERMLERQRHRAVAEVLLQEPQRYPVALQQLRRELRQRVADRGSFGALLEPLLRGRCSAVPSAAAAGVTGAAGIPATAAARRRWRRRAAQRQRRLAAGLSAAALLRLPRPLGRQRRRLGFADYLAETLGASGPTERQRRRLGRGPGAADNLLQRSSRQQTTAPGARPTAPGPVQRRRGPAAAEMARGQGYRREERLRCGGRDRGPGQRQIRLRGRRERLLASYLHVETDLHPFRGWPVDYHRDQCWDFWRLDRSLVPAATLERLELDREQLPPELQNYLRGRPDYYSKAQLEERAQLRSSREREDLDKKVVAELKKLCPPVVSQDRLEVEPIWQPGMEW